MREQVADLHRRQGRWPWWARAAWWVVLLPVALAAASAARLHGRARTGGYVVATLLAVAYLGAVAGGPQPAAVEPSSPRPARASTTTTEAERHEPLPSTAAPTTSTTSTTSTTAAPRPSTTSAPPQPAGAAATVERVVDGDTLVLRGGERVRLIGIDTPESVDPRRPVECFGTEAAARLRELVPPGTAVRVEHDVERTDRYGRTLAYLHRGGDGRFVNEAMVADGFAVVATYPPNVRHVELLRRREREARDAGRGLWGSCDGAGSSAAGAPPPVAGGAGGSRAGGGCDPAYPDVCIPPGPDLDCGQIRHRRIRVLPPDPHRLDGNGDGVGCEG